MKSQVYLTAALLFSLAPLCPAGAEDLFDKYCKVKEPLQRYPVPADDPPMLLVYGGQDDVIPARDGGNATHHPKFGENLCKRLRELGVECHYWAGTQYGKEGYVKADNPRYHGWGGVKNFVGDKLLGPGWDKGEAEGGGQEQSSAR